MKFSALFYKQIITTVFYLQRKFPKPFSMRYYGIGCSDISDSNYFLLIYHSFLFSIGSKGEDKAATAYYFIFCFILFQAMLIQVRQKYVFLKSTAV